MMRILSIDGVEYRWVVGKHNLVVRRIVDGKTDRKEMISYEDLYDATVDEIERAMWKGYFRVIPSAVARFIEKRFAEEAGE